MNDLTSKLKELLITKLLSNDQIVDEPYLYKGDTTYTRRMLAYEIENETEVGLETLTSIMMLSLDILSRQK